jgi:hypothetical protein
MAIFHESDLPDEYRQYAQIERDFFTLTGLGSPGGAIMVGPLDVDHPSVAALENAG